MMLCVTSFIGIVLGVLASIPIIQSYKMDEKVEEWEKKGYFK